MLSRSSKTTLKSQHKIFNYKNVYSCTCVVRPHMNSLYMDVRCMYDIYIYICSWSPLKPPYVFVYLYRFFLGVNQFWSLMCTHSAWCYGTCCPEKDPSKQKRRTWPFLATLQPRERFDHPLLWYSRGFLYVYCIMTMCPIDRVEWVKEMTLKCMQSLWQTICRHAMSQVWQIHSQAAKFFVYIT